jgi:4-hydroxythreonine-4-phosphate dehydrogenase
MGDGAGIGPELCLRLLAEPVWAGRAVIYGSGAVLSRTLDHLAALGAGLALPRALEVVPWGAWRASNAWTEPDEGVVRVVDVGERLPARARAELEGLAQVPFGVAYAPFGVLQREALLAAIEDARVGRVSALCTAPWNKKLLSLAGLPPTGHTEVLGEALGCAPTMMLAGDRLRVSLVTTHVPLGEVPRLATREAILATIRATGEGLRALWGIASPRLAVAGLNPHAGEGGVMGTEDDAQVRPAVEAARAQGWDVDGPWSSDTLFAKAGRAGWGYDAVVCMYHDQGLIPLKLLHFGAAANITLGLPILRTSVDHGTAWDIAGRGVADEGSLRYALELAWDLAQRRATR